MKPICFGTICPGDLVQVPRTQFAPMRRGWNGWLFSEGVVLEKFVGSKSGRPIVKVRFWVPAPGHNTYGILEKSFYGDQVFETGALGRARMLLQKEDIQTRADFDAMVRDEDVEGCDWMAFLADQGFLFPEERKGGEKE